MKQASYILLKTNLDATKVLGSILREEGVVWATNAYGPYQIVAYVEFEAEKDMQLAIENMRSRRFVTELDARIVKVIPNDEKLSSFKTLKKEQAVLLINVDYTKAKERDVTYALRTIPGIVWARAMWGPHDIIAIIEAEDKESMRNLICDEIKTLTGVRTNTTLYGY
jgi:DNA-binding Lrp family transcriptional regulator